MLFIIQALYFFLPAYISNMAPVILQKINVFPQPVDLNRTWNGKPIVGPNKTWGGLLYGTLVGTLIFFLQQQLYTISFFQNLSIINYSQQPLILGFLLAAGAILGDLAKSFIKRRLNKQPGSQWFPFDQLDYVIGALLLSLMVYTPPLRIVLTLLIIAPILHFIANRIGYLLGLKKVKW